MRLPDHQPGQRTLGFGRGLQRACCRVIPLLAAIHEVAYNQAVSVAR